MNTDYGFGLLKAYWRHWRFGGCRGQLVVVGVVVSEQRMRGRGFVRWRDARRSTGFWLTVFVVRAAVEQGAVVE